MAPLRWHSLCFQPYEAWTMALEVLKPGGIPSRSDTRLATRASTGKKETTILYLPMRAAAPTKEAVQREQGQQRVLPEPLPLAVSEDKGPDDLPHR